MIASKQPHEYIIMEIIQDQFGFTSVKSIKYVYPKLHERIMELSNPIDLLAYDRLFDLFVFEDTPEREDFWSSVNRFAYLEDAKRMQPHLFEQQSSTFVNCFGVEIHQNTQLRADDVIIDFTKKKRISDF